MKELYIQYSYSYEQWGVYDPDIEEFIHYHPSIKEVVTYAYELASLIKPCQVNFDSSISINELHYLLLLLTTSSG